MVLSIRLYRAQQLLHDQIFTTTLKQIFPSSFSASARYRDTAVVFEVSKAFKLRWLRLHFQTTADQHPFCMALVRFVKVEENIPVNRNRWNSHLYATNRKAPGEMSSVLPEAVIVRAAKNLIDMLFERTKSSAKTSQRFAELCIEM
ncbi:hypothetical protein KIN20_026243 [Parelaphostrongylus tenuis]|uniref:Uncharacterized protein n=1 Tax=Parelaphostrongylus tenuis TaxID=148309 RepID=A0AAD5NBD1_PARTN|nr:hypothetical protein KIN20_026243 [Parelaphostrongylus tenuis]